MTPFQANEFRENGVSCVCMAGNIRIFSRHNDRNHGYVIIRGGGYEMSDLNSFKENFSDGLEIINICLIYFYEKYTKNGERVPNASVGPLRHLMNEYLISNGRKLNYESVEASNSKSVTWDHVFGTTRAFKQMYVIYCDNINDNNFDVAEFIRHFLHKHIFMIKITKEENQKVKASSGSWVGRYKAAGIIMLRNTDTLEIEKLESVVEECSLGVEYMSEDLESRYFCKTKE